MTSATEVLRRLLDERGVDYFKHEDGEPLRKLEKADEPATSWHMGGASVCAVPIEDSDLFDLWIDHCTPEQAIAATLGSCNCSNNCTNGERTEMWVSPTWERWHKSLRHDEIKSIGDAVEQLMYEVIEFGGCMGPNGNTYNGIDEGDVLTAGYINEWVERFENMLGAGTCHMVLREDIRGHAYQDTYECSECGEEVVRETCMGESEPPNYCHNCGAKVIEPTTNDVDVEVEQ